MRIVIDLQGAQCGSRLRGIGRYSLAITKAIIENRGKHEIIIALNGLFPDTIEPIRAAFNDILPQDNIRVWHSVGPVHSIDPENIWRRHAAELMREYFLASLQPDIIYVTSLIEGFGDDAVHTIGLFPIPTAVTFYDLIPLIQSEVYLSPNPKFETLYREKLDYMRRADLFLSISESSRQEAIDHLNLVPDKVVNIAAAVDPQFKPTIIAKQEEQKLRQHFGLHLPFVMYSGATDDRKNHLRLIKAFSILPTKLRKNYQLAIVGGLPHEHRQKFEDYAKLCGLLPTELVITGRVSDDQMVQLYNLCTLFVFPSWHEGFGLPALEAMSCGAAVIGANSTSIPEVIGREDALFDPFNEKEISEKIEEVLINGQLSKDLRNHSLKQAKKFSWDESARRTISAFERLFNEFYTNDSPSSKVLSSQAAITRLTKEIAKCDISSVSEHDWIMTAQAISRNHSDHTQKQLLVDISELIQQDSKTGIQRVVRSVLAELFANPPQGFRIEPIYANSDESGYRYARQFTQRFLNQSNHFCFDDIVETYHGDIYLGLDLLHYFIVSRQIDFFQHLRRIGVKTYFVVYDLLPVLIPNVFPDHVPPLHAQWLGAVALSDGVLCISRSVASEMAEWLSVYGPSRLRPLNIGWFHLGSDLAGSIPTKGLPADINHVLKNLTSRPTFLIVGTIEPRKGQMQTLLAFEKLWSQGIDVNLVLVGKLGWNVEILTDILRTHSELNKRLYRLDGISDEYLERIYAASSCLIVASEGEGFGLPLIEAAQNRLPIIARDIPVFREVAGEHAYYFSNDSKADVLAVTIAEWLQLFKLNNQPKSFNMPYLTWHGSTKNLLDVIIGNNWSKRWMPDGISRYWGSDQRLGTQVGRRERQCMISANQAGYLIYGPYIALEVGSYLITIHGRGNTEANFGAKLDVSIERGTIFLADAPLNDFSNGALLAQFIITLESPCRDLEIRIIVDEKSEVIVSLLEIQAWHSSKSDNLIT